MNKLIPTYFANNIFEVDVSFYHKIGARILLLDLDNTLDSYKTNVPSKRVFDLINKLKANKIRPIITSNSNGKRVRNYAKMLGIEFEGFCLKPFGFRIKNKLKRLKINKDDCLLIGDQLLTDTLAGNRAKIRIMLVDKIVKEEAPFTRINNLFDKPYRARLRKCGKLNYWKDNV